MTLLARWQSQTSRRLSENVPCLLKPTEALNWPTNTPAAFCWAQKVTKPTKRKGYGNRFSLSVYGKRHTFTLQRAWTKGGELFGGTTTCSKYSWIKLSHYRLKTRRL